MEGNQEAVELVLHEIPVEKTGNLCTVEICHAPQGSSYLYIRMDLDRGMNYSECLRMAVFYFSYTMSSDIL